MIEITYVQNHNRVTITGHAQSGEAGHDLVCAGVTTLVYTLACNIQLLEEAGAVREMEVRLEPGDACVRCIPTSSMEATVKFLFTSICVGLEQMALAHPDCVRYALNG